MGYFRRFQQDDKFRISEGKMLCKLASAEFDDPCYRLRFLWLDKRRRDASFRFE